jgi:hypothetical protein
MIVSTGDGLRLVVSFFVKSSRKKMEGKEMALSNNVIEISWHCG